MKTQWKIINWEEIARKILKEQSKIGTAIRNNDQDKASELQRILVRSHWARLQAIHKVTSSNGANTPGIDNFIVKDENDLDTLYEYLKNINGYKARPVKRVGISKGNGKTRYLGIPTIQDRCMQSLFALALFPIAEVKADYNSYGFRPNRSINDAVYILYKSQFVKGTVEPKVNWIIDVDIKGFFDNISHDWIMKNIPIEKKILDEFIKAGFIEAGLKEPQGGIISPLIANMTLDGLEDYIRTGLKKLKIYDNTIYKTRIIRYADDVKIIAPYRWVVEKSLNIFNSFLKERGLRLNMEKSKIINLAEEKVDYLGFSIIRVSNNSKTLIIPNSDKVKVLIEKVLDIIKKCNKPAEIVTELNPILRGWANYYKGCSASDTFQTVSNAIHEGLIRWGKKRLLTRSSRQVYDKYFTTKENGSKELLFYYLNNEGKQVYLYDIKSTKIIYHKYINKPVFKSKENK